MIPRMVVCPRWFRLFTCLMGLALAFAVNADGVLKPKACAMQPELEPLRAALAKTPTSSMSREANSAPWCGRLLKSLKTGCGIEFVPPAKRLSGLDDPALGSFRHCADPETNPTTNVDVGNMEFTSLEHLGNKNMLLYLLDTDGKREMPAEQIVYGEFEESTRPVGPFPTLGDGPPNMQPDGFASVDAKMCVYGRGRIAVRESAGEHDLYMGVIRNKDYFLAVEYVETAYPSLNRRFVALRASTLSSSEERCRWSWEEKTENKVRK